MSGRPTAEIVADLRIAAGCLWTVSPDTRKVTREAADRLTELDALRPPCPTCDGACGWLNEDCASHTVCPDCVDGKVSIEQLAATWQAVWDENNVGELMGAEVLLVDHLRAVRP